MIAIAETVSRDQPALHDLRPVESLDGARKLCQHPVACGLDDAAVLPRRLGPNDPLENLHTASVGVALVRRHQDRIADDVREGDGDETMTAAAVWHPRPPSTLPRNH